MLVDSGRWSVSAGSKKSGEPKLPAAYSAQITKSVNSALKMAGIGSGSTPKSKEIPTCTHCKKRGHTKEKCWQLHGRPEKQTSSNSPSQQSSPNNSWFTERGDKSVFEKSKDGKKYFWCTKCSPAK